MAGWYIKIGGPSSPGVIQDVKRKIAGDQAFRQIPPVMKRPHVKNDHSSPEEYESKY